jgi:acetyl esterase/lipase
MKVPSFLKFSLIFGLFSVLALSCSDPESPIPDGLDPAKAHTEIDLAYGTDPRQVMDVYLPANRDQSRTRVFVWIHGGGWIDGDKSELEGFKPWLENVQDDYAYIGINYRLFNFLGNANRFPTQEEDIKKAMAFIKSKLEEWDLSENLVLAGASAGGHLTLLHSYKNNGDGLVKAAVAFFPPTELRSFHSSSPTSRLLLENLLGGTPESIPLVYSNSSPLVFVKEGSVPTAFFHGDVDTVVPIAQSKILETRLVASKVPHLKEYLPGQGHGFDEETYKRLIGLTEAFLDSVLP